jgi:hypothetical protein
MFCLAKTAMARIPLNVESCLGGELRDCLFNQSQESGVAHRRFEPYQSMALCN